jgi:hypothetical protein
MPKTFESWTVLPHRPIAKLEDNLWLVEGRLDFIRRVMVMARLKDRRLVIWNGIALDEPEMKELEAWGTPAFLVVPNGFHRQDAKIWKKRYPAMQVICPPAAKKRVEQVVPVDRTDDGVFGDDSVRCYAPPPTGGKDAVLEVRSNGGRTLVINDIVVNQRHGAGARGLVFRLMGFTAPKPHAPFFARLLSVTDKPGLKRWLEEQASSPDLKRVIVSHGDRVEDNPAQALRDAANSY